MLKDKLKSEQRGVESSLDNSLRMRLLRPFGPEALQVSRDLRDDSTSSGVIIIVSNLSFYSHFSICVDNGCYLEVALQGRLFK